MSNGEWKWTAALIAPFAAPVLFAAALVGWCLWRERVFTRRMDEMGETFEIWEDEDRKFLIADAELREDTEVATLETIPHGDDWDIPTEWHGAA